MLVFMVTDIAQSEVYADEAAVRLLDSGQYLWLTMVSVTFCVYLGATISRRGGSIGIHIKFLCLFTFLIAVSYQATLMPVLNYVDDDGPPPPRNVSYSIALLTIYFVAGYTVSQWRIQKIEAYLLML